MERIKYFVTLKNGQWFVVLQGKHHGPYDTQHDAIEAAVQAAHQTPNSQVLVQGENNQIRTEWTYGHDPRRYPG
jgi:hypothetical protein